MTKHAAAIGIKAIADERKCRPPDVAAPRADIRRCRDREDLGRYRGAGTAEHVLVACVFLWLAGLRGSAFHCAASALASATDGSFAAASLRNSAARPKVFPMG